jgi:hypothetical protein
MSIRRWWRIVHANKLTSCHASCTYAAGDRGNNPTVATVSRPDNRTASSTSTLGWLSLNIVLQNFARRAYALREQAEDNDEPGLASFAKCLINALPGKLGYRFRCWDIVPGAV